MANPASITINDIAAKNSSQNQASAQTIDTTGTVNCPAAGKFSRLFFLIVNAASAAATITIKGGTSGAALQSQDLAVTAGATGGASASKIIGPFESSQFMKPDGSLDIAFSPASGSLNLSITAYRLPKA